MCAAGLLALAGCGLLDGAYFMPDRRDHSRVDSNAAPGRDIWFRAADGPVLHGLWIDAVGRSRGTVVYCHGNDRNLTRHAPLAAWLAERGFDVLVFDYRGYGRSAGVAGRTGLLRDTLAAVDLALTRDPQRTVVFGRSLGGAYAVLAASRRPAVRGVVLEAPLAGWRSVAARRFPWLSWLVPLLVSDGPDPRDALTGIRGRPLLVVHATGDPIVPFPEGLELFAMHRGPKRMLAFGAKTHRPARTVLGARIDDEVDRFLSEALHGPGWALAGERSTARMRNGAAALPARPVGGDHPSSGPRPGPGTRTR